MNKEMRDRLEITGIIVAIAIICAFIIPWYASL